MAALRLASFGSRLFDPGDPTDARRRIIERMLAEAKRLFIGRARRRNALLQCQRRERQAGIRFVILRIDFDRLRIDAADGISRRKMKDAIHDHLRIGFGHAARTGVLAPVGVPC